MSDKAPQVPALGLGREVMLQVEQMGNELDELDLACAALIDALELVDRDKPELVERARAAIENLERLSPC